MSVNAVKGIHAVAKLGETETGAVQFIKLRKSALLRKASNCRVDISPLTVRSERYWKAGKLCWDRLEYLNSGAKSQTVYAVLERTLIEYFYNNSQYVVVSISCRSFEMHARLHVFFIYFLLFWKQTIYRSFWALFWQCFKYIFCSACIQNVYKCTQSVASMSILIEDFRDFKRSC